MSVFVEGCVAVVSYLLTFQSMADRTWCILISLNCCRSDVSHATGGLADGYKVIYTGCGLGMFRCRQLAQWPALLIAGLPGAYLASHDILETVVEARVPYMECWSASGLTAYFGMSA